MKQLSMGFCVAMGMLLLAVGAHAQKGDVPGQGRAIVTVLPAHPGDAAVRVTAQQLKLKVNGKDASVMGLKPLREANSPVELVVLIDGSARESLSEQFGGIEGFVKEMPSNTRIAIAYMENGQAKMAGPLSSDAAQVLNGLHMPGGSAGVNGSPYFCLSDLAKHWPSHDASARREVVMITDGVDDYEPHYDPDDQYVQAAITDAVHAGLVIYAIYWRNQGRMDRTGWADNAGQNLLMQVTQATGGNNYWEGFGNPVSFDPYFQDLRIRLRNQYGLVFSAPLRGKPEAEQLQLKASIPGAKLDAPQQVWVEAAGAAQN